MAYVCYQKLSKRKKQEIDRAKRGTWGNISPVTQKVASQKVYNRKKTQRWQVESPTLGFFEGQKAMEKFASKRLLTTQRECHMIIISNVNSGTHAACAAWQWIPLGGINRQMRFGKAHFVIAQYEHEYILSQNAE